MRKVSIRKRADTFTIQSTVLSSALHQQLISKLSLKKRNVRMTKQESQGKSRCLSKASKRMYLVVCAAWICTTKSLSEKKGIWIRKGIRDRHVVVSVQSAMTVLFDPSTNTLNSVQEDRERSHQRGRFKEEGKDSAPSLSRNLLRTVEMHGLSCAFRDEAPSGTCKKGAWK